MDFIVELLQVTFHGHLEKCKNGKWKNAIIKTMWQFASFELQIINFLRVNIS